MHLEQYLYNALKLLPINLIILILGGYMKKITLLLSVISTALMVSCGNGSDSSIPVVPVTPIAPVGPTEPASTAKTLKLNLANAKGISTPDSTSPTRAVTENSGLLKLLEDGTIASAIDSESEVQCNFSDIRYIVKSPVSDDTYIKLGGYSFFQFLGEQAEFLTLKQMLRIDSEGNIYDIIGDNKVEGTTSGGTSDQGVHENPFFDNDGNLFFVETLNSESGFKKFLKKYNISTKQIEHVAGNLEFEHWISEPAMSRNKKWIFTTGSITTYDSENRRTTGGNKFLIRATETADVTKTLEIGKYDGTVSTSSPSPVFYNDDEELLYVSSTSGLRIFKENAEGTFDLYKEIPECNSTGILYASEHYIVTDSTLKYDISQSPPKSCDNIVKNFQTGVLLPNGIPTLFWPIYANGKIYAIANPAGSATIVEAGIDGTTRNLLSDVSGLTIYQFDAGPEFVYFIGLQNDMNIIGQINLKTYEKKITVSETKLKKLAVYK